MSTSTIFGSGLRSTSSLSLMSSAQPAGAYDWAVAETGISRDTSSATRKNMFNRSAITTPGSPNGVGPIFGTAIGSLGKCSHERGLIRAQPYGKDNL